MRHGNKINHLGRTYSHRASMLRNMASSLILHKRINTTVAKAKELRKFIEPLITKSKDNTTHSRRVVFSYLPNKEDIKELFGTVAAKVGDRPGGYVRIIKTGFRKGDGAETAMIELVDFNELLLNSEDASKKKTRRGRRTKSTGTAPVSATPIAAPVVVEEAIEIVDDVVAEPETIIVNETEMGTDPEEEKMDDLPTEEKKED
jgi:large subunit ribosomal protein L17